jgi:hypothetical protein
MKCPYYSIFSSPKAAFNAGPDCIEADCIYWRQARGEGHCDIKDREHAEKLFRGEER